MASNRGRRNARVTNDGSNAMGIQRKINRDYEILARDYKKLFVEIWRIPATKYVLGGAALAALIPFAQSWLSNNPDITDRFTRFLPKNVSEFDAIIL